MAIDPKLVSIIPASDLPTGDPTSAGQFFFFEGNEMQKAPMTNIYDKVTSGITGEATQSNAPTAWTTGDPYLFERWIVTAPLTLPNSWGFEVTQLELDENFVFFNVTDGVVSKELSEKRIAALTNTLDPLDETEAVTGKAVGDYVAYDFKDFIMGSGILRENGHVNSGSSFKYTPFIPINLNGFTLNNATASVNVAMVAFYDVNEVFISALPDVTSSALRQVLSSEIPSNTKYVRATALIESDASVSGLSVDVTHDRLPIGDIFINKGYVRTGNGILYPSSSYECTDFIDIENFETFHISASENSDTVPLCIFYDANQKYISEISDGVVGNVLNRLVTKPVGAKYVRLNSLVGVKDRGISTLSSRTFFSALKSLKVVKTYTSSTPLNEYIDEIFIEKGENLSISINKSIGRLLVFDSTTSDYIGSLENGTATVDPIVDGEVYKIIPQNGSDVSGYVIFKNGDRTSTSNSQLLADAYSLSPKINNYITLQLNKDLNPLVPNMSWTSKKEINNCIEELYLPNISDFGESVSIVNFTSNDTAKSVMIMSGATYLVNTGSRPQVADSDTQPIFTLHRWGDYGIVGYVIFKKGYEYTTSGSSHLLNYSLVENIENSPKIKAMLENPKQVILMGDSIIGMSSAHNTLADNLQGLLGCKVHNIAFAGCRMAYRGTSGALDKYDAFTLPAIVDALLTQDYSWQISANATIGNNNYWTRISELMNDIDLTRPTIIFENYGNNDLTGAQPIGDLWDYTQTFAEDFDKFTTLGAMNYGLNKLLTSHPHIQFAQFSTAYRYMGNGVLPDGETTGTPVPPYAYSNGVYTAEQFDEQVRLNTKRLGIAYIWFDDIGVRNAFSVEQGAATSYVLADRSHYNYIGHYKFAKWLKNLVQKFD